MFPNGDTLLSKTGSAVGDADQSGTVNPLDDIACSLLLEVTIDATGTVVVKADLGGTTYNLLGTNVTSGATTASITASGLYRFDVSGCTNVKPSASANTGAITVKGRMVRG